MSHPDRPFIILDDVDNRQIPKRRHVQTFKKLTIITRAIAKKAGHHLLFLPRYSPDFNPIEQSFAILKKRRQFAPKNTAIDQLLNVKLLS
jgi:transposase